MLYEEREEQIMQQLQLSSAVKAAELTRLFHVSVDTIRRDLKCMEEKGLLKCVRGGACLPETAFSNFSGREVVHIGLKRQAAKKATAYIKEGDTLALNAGTTNTILAQELVKLQKKLTVVTNNLAAVSVLMQNPLISVILAGGFVDPTERALYGPACRRELLSYHPDLCFLSINAVHPQAGYTDFRFQEMDLMQCMASTAKKTAAVMDSSKLDRIAKKTVFSVEQIDLLILDDETPEEKKRDYLEQGIPLV